MHRRKTTMGSSQSLCFRPSSSSSSGKERGDADDRDWKCAGVSAHDELSQPVARPPMAATPVVDRVKEQTANTTVRDGRTVIRKKVPDRGRSGSRHSQREPWTPALTRTPSRGRSSEFSRQSVEKDRAKRLASLRGPPPLAYRPPRSSSLSRPRSHSQSQSRPGTAPNGSTSRRHDSGASASHEHLTISSPAKSRASHVRRSSIPADFELSPVIKSRVDIQTMTRQVHAAATSSPPPRRRPPLNKKVAVAELSASPVLKTSKSTFAAVPLAGATPSHADKKKQDSGLVPAPLSLSRQSTFGPPSMPLPEPPPRRKSPYIGPIQTEGRIAAADKAILALPSFSPLDSLSRGKVSPSSSAIDLTQAQEQRPRQIASKMTPMISVDESVDTSQRQNDDNDIDIDDTASLSTSTSSTRSSLSLSSPATGGGLLSAYSLFPRPALNTKTLATVPSWMDLGDDDAATSSQSRVSSSSPAPSSTSRRSPATTRAEARSIGSAATPTSSSAASVKTTAPILDAPLRQIGLAMLRAQQ